MPKNIGASWKSKMVVGTLMKIVRSRVKDRRTTSVLAEWELVEETKVVCLRLINIKAVGEEEESMNPVQVVIDGGDHVLESASDVEDFPNALVTPDSSELVLTRSTSPGEAVHQVGPVTNCDGNDWVKSDVKLALNGFVKSRRWKVIGPVDGIITAGHGPFSLTPYDFFTWMFPLDHLGLIVNHTNKKLNNRGLPVTSRREVLRYFGILVLMTRCQFGNRRDLWSSKSHNHYLSPPLFGNIMSLKRFEELRCHITLSLPSDEADR